MADSLSFIITIKSSKWRHGHVVIGTLEFWSPGGSPFPSPFPPVGARLMVETKAHKLGFLQVVHVLNLNERSHGLFLRLCTCKMDIQCFFQNQGVKEGF